MSSILTTAKAALYWGAKCIVSTSHTTEIHQIVAISETELLLGYDWASISDCKLILRTVEQLTDEELSKVCEIGDISKGYLKEEYGYSYWSLTNIDIGRRIATDFINDCGDPIRISPENAKKVADYLRSIHVDIDNAISDGWAVQEQTN